MRGIILRSIGAITALLIFSGVEADHPCPDPITADQVQFHFSGKATYQAGIFSGEGSAVSGTITYDKDLVDNTPGSAESDTFAIHPGPNEHSCMEVTVTNGSVTLSSADNTSPFYSLHHSILDNPNVDRWYFAVTPGPTIDDIVIEFVLQEYGPPEPDGVAVGSYNLTDVAPTSPPNVDDFNCVSPFDDCSGLVATNSGSLLIFQFIKFDTVPIPPGLDTDGDGVIDPNDLCPDTAGGIVDSAGCADDQVDNDTDNYCNPGAPSPGPAVCTGTDNCPDDPNPQQSDVDADLFGDLCDICPSDATNTCDPLASDAEEISAMDGGTVTTNGDVTITIPPGALTVDTTIAVTDTGSGFELTTNSGQKAVAVFGVEITPAGTLFNPPITIVFAWDDVDNNDEVDVLNFKENNLKVTKNNAVVDGTSKCSSDPGCDKIANTFTFTVSSLSEFTLSGPKDTDGDGVPDNFDGVVDACPTEDATGFDVNNDGCIDWFNGLIDLVSGLVIEGVISEQMETSLLAKVGNAQNSYDRDNVCTGMNQLEAFKGQVDAQRDKKISNEAADEVTAFADSVIAVLESQLLAGEAC